MQHRRKTVVLSPSIITCVPFAGCFTLLKIGAIARAPKLKLLSGENQREYVITDDIIEKFAKDRGRMGKIVPFLCDTGLRRSEICNLTWTAVKSAVAFH